MSALSPSGDDPLRRIPLTCIAEVHQQIFASIFWDDETEPFGFVDPFVFAFSAGGRSQADGVSKGGRSNTARAASPQRPVEALESSRCVRSTEIEI